MELNKLAAVSKIVLPSWMDVDSEITQKTYEYVKNPNDSAFQTNLDSIKS